MAQKYRREGEMDEVLATFTLESRIPPRGCAMNSRNFLTINNDRSNNDFTYLLLTLLYVPCPLT